MFDAAGGALRGLMPVLAGLLLLPLGCAAESNHATDSGGDRERKELSLEERARAVFETDSFQRYLAPTPRPDGELLNVTLVRVSDTGRAADAYDIGYIREERLVFVLPDRPWEERDEAQIDVRTEDVFPHPVEQPDGSHVLYQAVERRLITVLDLAGQPRGTVDDSGNIYRFRARDAQLELVGYGSPEQAIEQLFDIRSYHRVDRETYEPVSHEPQVFLVPLDGERAEERFDRTIAEGLVQRGRERLAEGLLDEAQADFDRALEERPDLVEARVARAELHRLREDFEAALADYDTALAEEESRWDVWVARGRVLGELQRRRDAEDAFREAYRHAPEDALAEIRRAEEETGVAN